MHRIRRRTAAFATACVALAFAISCDSAPSEPLDPALTGEWIAPGVDTRTQLNLQQRGTIVTGTFLFSSPVGGPDTLLVIGTAKLPHVVLEWGGASMLQHFEATLSADQQTLDGTINHSGSTLTFHREIPISGIVAR